jgi:hypothetical protein
MASKQEKKEQAQRTREPQDPKDREPREDLKDESQARNRKVEVEQFDQSPAPVAGAPDDPAADKEDESQERNEKVTAEMEADEEDLGLRSEKDGGFEDEDLPVVRVGEVYEDVRPFQDDHRRYVKVIDVPEKGKHKGSVLVKNEESYVESYIRRDRFTPENGWARFAS